MVLIYGYITPPYTCTHNVAQEATIIKCLHAFNQHADTYTQLDLPTGPSMRVL